MAGAAPTTRRRIVAIARPAASLIILLVLLEGLKRLGLLPVFVPAPSEVFNEILKSPRLVTANLGPTAFKDDEHTKFPKWERPIERGDWVLYRNSDGWDKDIQVIGEYTAVKCRVIQDAYIRGRVKYPGRLL